LSKRWVIALVGVMSVLGFAAYMSLKSPTQPAASIRVAVPPGARKPGAASFGQTASSAGASRGPVAQETRLPEQAPSQPPATGLTRRGTGFRSRHNSYPQIRRTANLTSSDGTVSQPASQKSSAFQDQQPASNGPRVPEASNLGPGPDVAGTNSLPQTVTPTPPPAETPPAAPAAPASAVLMPHGSILLNGHPATDSTALFPGDRIQVPDGSYASINGKGSLTVLQPGSSVVYTNKGLELEQGGLAVSTLESMPVNTEGLSIVPRTGHGKYDVLDDNGTVQIASLEGDLNIQDGGQATVLAQGQQTTRDKRKRLAADAPPDGPPAPETPPATASGGFPAGKVLLIGGAVGGGIVAAVLLTRSSSKPVSPAVP
jgi:hypothetical protein